MKHWSIRYRILLIALLPGVMVSLLLGMFFIVGRATDLSELLETRALAMGKQLAPTCEYGVMTGNRGILQNIANNMLEERDVRAVNLFDQEMNLLAHAGPRMISDRVSATALKDDQLQLVNTAGSVRVKAPIFAQNLVISDQLAEQFYAQSQTTEMRLLGWAEIELSNSNTRLLQYQLITSSLTIIIVVLLLGSAFAIRVSRNISGPIQDIRNALNDIRGGKLDTRIHVNAHGELQDLAAGVNAMAAAMQRGNVEHQHALEQSSRESQETIDELEIRNHELMIEHRNAVESSRTKSQFLANVSHEIRTPLNGIIGFSDLLARTEVSDRQGEYVDTIRRSSEDLLNIINDILDLSKIDAGKLILENASFDLRDLVEEVLQVLTPLAAGKGIDVYQYISPDLPDLIIGDRLRLKQVITNLCSNAIKFTPEGGVSIAVTPIQQEFGHISIQFDVVDTGIGMTPEQQSRLFQAFSQADPGIARQYGGTGLGLIISRALIEAMKGDIKVQSEQGIGSTFSFTIDAELDESNTMLPASLKGLKVALINPGDAPTQDTMHLLEKRGAALKQYHSPDQVPESCEGHPTDIAIIFCDKNMIDSEGINEWLEICRNKDISVLTISKSALPEQTAARLTTPLLTSPFTQHQLVKQLELLSGRAVETPELPDLDAEQEIPTVLAVDDNEANLKLVVTLLGELGVTVLEAPSGFDAVAMATRDCPDLILMDIQMPGMSGNEATARIRKLPGKHDLPIVALTAHAMSDERQALIANGFSDYQTKPVSMEQLARIIERWTGFKSSSEQHTPLRQGTFVSTDIFNRELSLHQANGNPGLAIDMFNMLLDMLRKEKDNLLDLWEEEELEGLLGAIHRLHGAARYCGVPALRAALEAFESGLKAKQSQDYPQQLRQVMTETERLLNWSSDQNWRAQLESDNTEKA
ncbi:MAG: response regulator [Pseudomonadota bacterium]|nr:response regulator [Pseudomonadota bacterium]MEC8525264.1 response regulator [Pseudomonadota bacterium]